MAPVSLLCVSQAPARHPASAPPGRGRREQPRAGEMSRAHDCVGGLPGTRSRAGDPQFWCQEPRVGSAPSWHSRPSREPSPTPLPAAAWLRGAVGSFLQSPTPNLVPRGHFRRQTGRETGAALSHTAGPLPAQPPSLQRAQPQAALQGPCPDREAQEGERGPDSLCGTPGPRVGGESARPGETAGQGRGQGTPREGGGAGLPVTA